MEYTERQQKIVDIIKEQGPITGSEIAKMLGVTRGALRTDFSVLTKDGIVASKTKIGYTYTGKKRAKVATLKKVEECMGEPNLLEEGTTVHDAILSIFLKDTGSIYVTKDGYLSGVISRKDLLRHLMAGSDSKKSPLGMIMTRKPSIVYTVASDDVVDAAKKMVEHEVDSLPVVEVLENNRLKVVGRISKTTIAKIFVEEFTN